MVTKSNKLLAGFIIVMALLMFPLPALAGAWQPVGSPGFSAGQVGYTSLYVDNGTPYVAYTDFFDEDNYGKATVMKYVYGTGWEAVGTPRFSTGAAVAASLYVDSGTPYVAYAEYIDEDNYGRATVMKYVYGTGWEPVGTPGFSAGEAKWTSLIIDNGTLYVAYEDVANDNKATVMKYVYGSDWETVGTAGFSAGNVENISLYVDDGTPYMAYLDLTDGRKVTVMKYVQETGWETVGTPGLAGADCFSGFGGQSVLDGPSLYVDNGTPYVAYTAKYGWGSMPPLASFGVVTVMKYVPETGWEVVGDTPRGISNSETIDNVSLYVDSGIPYVAYSNAYGLAAVERYVSGIGWEPLGGVLDGITSTTLADNPSLSSLCEEAGMPFSWIANFMEVAAFLMQGDAGESGWGYYGTCSTGLVYNLSLQIDNGTPYVAYLDDANGGKSTVMAYLPGNDATLSDLKVNGDTVAGFVYNDYDYSIQLPYNTRLDDPAATVSATPDDPKASVAVTQAETLPGSATVEVTAEDDVTKLTYTINLTLEAEPPGNGGSGSPGNNGESDESAGSPAARTSIITSSVSTDGDRLLDSSLLQKGKAVLDLADIGGDSANISGEVIQELSGHDEPFTVKNNGISLDFPPGSLDTEQVTGGNGTVVEVGARGVSGKEKENLLHNTPPGESSGLFEIGGQIFDLTALLKTRGEDGKVSTEKIEKFSKPVAVTIDLSHLGELTEEQINQLTGVRLEKDEEGNIVPVKLGGNYDPDTQTFTFYTGQFSLYTVMQARQVQQQLQIKLALGSIRATVNDQLYTLDAAPYLDTNTGRTLVPLRFVSEALGAAVDWKAETRQVTINDNGKEIILIIGSRDVLVNGRKTTIDSAPAILPPGRSFVPLRFVSETLGARVDWDGTVQGITITR